MKTDIFESINSKLTPDQSVITELLNKAETYELPEEPVIETQQAPAELIPERVVREKQPEPKAEPKAKVRSRFLPFVAVAAALVLVCTGGFFLLRGSDLKTAPGASDTANEKDLEKLKEANSNAKLLFTVVNSSITDLIADGNEVSVQEYKNSDNYGKVISLNELADGFNGRIIDVDGAEYIDYCICSAFRDNDAEKGYIYFEIDDENNVVAAQWAESTDEGIVGQYPDPEFDPTVKHKIGEIYHSVGYDDYNVYDEVWDGLSVEIEPDSVTPTGLTVNFTRSCDLLDNQYQMVKSDYELFAYNDGSLDELDFISDARGYEYREGVLRKENDALIYKYDWSNLYGALEPGDYSMVIHVITNGEDVRETQNYELQFTIPAEPVEVPDVVGMTSEQAQTALTQAGFKCIIRERYDDNAEKGIVVKQDKEAGTEYKTGEEIVLFVSAGQVETGVKVPDVRDMTEEEAVDLIKENKLTPVVEYIRHSDSTSGRVVVQSPAAGTYLDKNSEVKLQISKGVGDLPDNWGLTLRADYVTPTGLSLYITSDGSAADYDVTTGTYFKLYKMNGDTAEELELVNGSATFTSLGLTVNTYKNAVTKFDASWQRLYGELPAGTYKIEKTLRLSSGLDGDQDSREQKFGCVFTVE